MYFLDEDFDAKNVICEIKDWIINFFEKNGKDCKAVIAVSGGKDSSVATALCAEALGRERVFGILLPNGLQPDIGASSLLVKTLGIDYTVINIGDTYETLRKSIEDKLGKNLSYASKTNMPARLRMTTTYAVAQSMNGRVVNTCNLSEDWVGYSTRYGDSVGDFSPLSRLTASEVVAIGECLGLPKALVNKVPIDGLSGKTDEQNLGFSYGMLDRYIRTGICENKEIKTLIDKKHDANKFKLELMPSYEYKGKILADE